MIDPNPPTPVNLLVAQESAKPAELPSFGEALVRMSISLGIVVAALVAVAIIVRRLRKGSRLGPNGRTLRVVETLDLDMRHRLYVVESGAESLLLGVSPDRIELLSRAVAVRAASQEGAETVAPPSTATGLRNAALAFDRRDHHG